MSEKEQLEKYIKGKLILRGFTKEQILNNRGIIGAALEEIVLLVGIGSLGIRLTPKEPEKKVCPECNGNGFKGGVWRLRGGEDCPTCNANGYIID